MTYFGLFLGDEYTEFYGPFELSEHAGGFNV